MGRWRRPSRCLHWRGPRQESSWRRSVPSLRHPLGKGVPVGGRNRRRCGERPRALVADRVREPSGSGGPSHSRAPAGSLSCAAKSTGGEGLGDPRPDEPSERVRQTSPGSSWTTGSTKRSRQPRSQPSRGASGASVSATITCSSVEMNRPWQRAMTRWRGHRNLVRHASQAPERCRPGPVPLA